jgi:hypothetical protein
MAVKKYALDNAKRVLGDSGLAERIIGSEGGFEMHYKKLDMRAIASGNKHAFSSTGSRTVKNPTYYEFLDEALFTVIELGGGGYGHRVEFTSKKFMMDERAVELFSEGWRRLSGQPQTAIAR